MNIPQQTIEHVSAATNVPNWRTINEMAHTGGATFIGHSTYHTANQLSSDASIAPEMQRKLELGFALLSEAPTPEISLCGPEYNYTRCGGHTPTFNKNTKVHLSTSFKEGLKLHPDAKVVEAAFAYNLQSYAWHSRSIFVSCIIEFQNEVLALQVPLQTAQYLFKTSFDKNGTMVIQGIKLKLDLDKINLDVAAECSLVFASKLRTVLNVDMNTVLKLIQAHLANKPGMEALNGMATNGINKTVAQITPFARQLLGEQPLLYAMLCDLTHLARRTVGCVKMSTVFNQVFVKIKTYDGLVAFLQSHIEDITASYYHELGYQTETVLTNTPEYKEIRKTSLKSGARRAFNKLMEDIDFLNLDDEKYPKLYLAITEGEIPLSTFFRKKEQYFLLNSNWQLWEEMLTHQPDVTKELAKEVARRTTYEKDLMSYFYFLLYGLPEYLEQHTGRKWRVYGRLVESASELDAPNEDQKAGVTKKRSALTPIVENEMGTVIVPYASLAIAGRMTQYCYSHDYHVLERGFSFNGNTVMNNVEVALNGRDDYGLMFYTLTGSYTSRGYPTFLIIFEKRSDQTFVHFHRTHPCRSKDDDYNPVHDWVRVCYNWMVGNIPAKDIVAQQGDMVFVRHEHGEACTELVKAYEGHCFDQPVQFAPYTKKQKQNVLGYLNLTSDTWLRHHEHEDVLIPAGTYEIRQCRSWEANPVAIWTLRID